MKLRRSKNRFYTPHYICPEYLIISIVASRYVGAIDKHFSIIYLGEVKFHHFFYWVKLYNLIMQSYANWIPVPYFI